MKNQIVTIASIVCIFSWLVILTAKDLWFEEKEIAPSVNLVAWGDIMISRGIGRWAKMEGYDRVFRGDNYNPLTQYDCYQSWDCVLFFNLESMFSKQDNDWPEATFLFRSNTKNVQYLLDLKRENKLMLSLANNHTSNAGWDGIIVTREVLDWENIEHIWAWATTEEAETIKMIEKDGISLCFQAFSYDWKSWNYYWKPIAWNSLNEDLMLNTLSWMNTLWCDVKILSLHRGREYSLHPDDWQREMAYKLIDAWADIILWGHSHVPWSYERYKWKPIFYSFGNFIFDQDRGKKSADFDYIYDFELKRRTVPTYIPLLAGMKITKYGTWIDIWEPEFKMARIWKWLYSLIDDETFTSVMSEIAL
jgi:poly-gamma-glutamate synthesis protein (capsule biosynthesis protein)